MAESSNEKSHLRCKIIIEVLGKPREHTESTIRDYVEKIKKDSNLILLSSSFSDAVKQGEHWSTFTELEIVIKGLHNLVAFCFAYMPSSVQIVKPEEFSLKAESIEDFINNLQARLHDVDMVIKQLHNENHFLKKNMNVAVKNSILISLVTQPMNANQLSSVTGIHKNELELFLNQLVADKKITEENGLYYHESEKPN